MKQFGRRGFGAGLGVMLVALGLGCMQKQAQHATGAEQGFGELTVDEVAKMIESNSITAIDNNSEEVFKKGHVPGAKWVAFNNVQAQDLPADKDRPLVFYCANSR